MTQYETLDAFITDFPILAEGAKDRLKGHEGAFRLETREGRIFEAEIFPDGSVAIGGLTREPDCTVTAAECDLLAVIQGRMKPATAVLFGKIKARGQITRLMSLIALVG